MDGRVDLENADWALLCTAHPFFDVYDAAEGEAEKIQGPTRFISTFNFVCWNIVEKWNDKQMRYFLLRTTENLADEWTVDACTPGLVLQQNAVSEQLCLFFFKLFVYWGNWCAAFRGHPVGQTLSQSSMMEVKGTGVRVFLRVFEHICLCISWKTAL